MPAARYDIEIEQGATFKRTLTLKEDDVAINLDGYSALMQIREEPASTDPLATITITFLDPVANGKIELLLSALETTDLPTGIFYYDLSLISGGGEAERWLEGKVLIDEAVSR